jgi:TRAP-type C4-dicarboxylate transport system permease small subunit
LTRLLRLFDWIAGLCGAAALLVALVSVAARYLRINAIFDWADEVTIMLLIWGMMFTALRTTVERTHISVDLLTHNRSGPWVSAIKAFSALALLAFSLMLAISGSLVTLDALMLGERTESSLGLPSAVYFAALPVGMALVVLGVIINGLRSKP